jgi:hypothetical protein
MAAVVTMALTTTAPFVSEGKGARAQVYAYNTLWPVTLWLRSPVAHKGSVATGLL